MSSTAGRVFSAKCSCGKSYRVVIVDVEAVPLEHRAKTGIPKDARPLTAPQEGRNPVEQLIDFNGVKVLLTTGQRLSEVQNYLAEADVVFSVYARNIRVLYSKYPLATDPNFR
jgi:hypothetical protein